MNAFPNSNKYFLFKVNNKYITLFRMGFFRAAHEWAGAKKPTVLKNHEACHGYTLPKKDSKKY